MEDNCWAHQNSHKSCSVCQEEVCIHRPWAISAWRMETVKTTSQDLHFIFYNWYWMCWLTLPNEQLVGIVNETCFTWFVVGGIVPAQLSMIMVTQGSKHLLPDSLDFKVWIESVEDLLRLCFSLQHEFTAKQGKIFEGRWMEFTREGSKCIFL